MKINDLKEKISLARKAVESEDEPFKTAAFTVILGKLLDRENITVDENQPTSIQKPHEVNYVQPSSTTNVDVENGKRNLAKNCDITVQELDDVVSFNKGIVQIIAPISGRETDKQIIATQCTLLSYEVVLGVEWVSSSLLRKCIDLSGIGQLDHLARNIRRNPNLIRAKGKKPNLEYKLFGPGRVSAIESIKKLVKGETNK